MVGPAKPTNKRICILRHDGKLGDSITATGFLHELTSSGFKVDLIVSRGQGWLFQGISGVTIHELSKGFFPALKLLFMLWNQSFDVLINTTHVMKARTVMLTALIAANRKISFACQSDAVFSEHLSFNPLTHHILDRFQIAFKVITGFERSLSYHLQIPTKDIQEVDSILKEYQILPGSFVVLNSFAGARARNLNFESVKKICQMILDINPRVDIVLMANAGDQKILGEWNQIGLPSQVKIVAKITSFWQNAALIKMSKAVISPDTSIVHAASALKKPLIAIYRPDLGFEKNLKIWAPLDGPKVHQVISEVGYSRGGLDINFLNELKLKNAISEAVN